MRGSLGRPPRRTSGLLLPLLWAAACSSGSPTHIDDVDPPVDVSLTLQASVSGSVVSAIVVEVTGPGIAQAIVANFEVEDDAVEGTVVVSAGPARVFSA